MGQNTSVGSSQSLEDSEANGGEARFAPTLGLTFVVVSFFIFFGVITLEDLAFIDKGSAAFLDIRG